MKKSVKNHFEPCSVYTQFRNISARNSALIDKNYSLGNALS